MSTITVTDLQRPLRQAQSRRAGRQPSTAVKAEYILVKAVCGFSFEMEPGELCGFIKPNGARKSTAIKFLTGILHPSSGQAQGLGFSPWKERQKLAFKIGTGFGQRPQFRHYLPAIYRSRCSEA